MESNGTLSLFFEDLRALEEIHRTEDYVEFQLVRIEEGETITYNVYLLNVPGIGWKFDGL